MKERSKVWSWALAGIIMVAVLCGSFTKVYAADKSEAQGLVDKANGTINEMMSNKAFTWLHEYLKDAKAVLIFPQVLKGGFFVGGSGGSGVLLVRNQSDGTWSEPAFYTLGSVTFGLQIGGEAAEVVMVAVNQRAVDSLLNSSVKLGGDASVAIGPVGGGAKGSVTVPEVRADFVSFTRAKGLYAGLNLEGSVVAVRDKLNAAYYGNDLKPRDIVFSHKSGNPGAHHLRSSLERMSAR